MTTLPTRRTMLATGATLTAMGATVPQALPALPQANENDLGIDPKRLAKAYDLLEEWTDGPNAPVPGGAILVGRFGKAMAPRFFGRQGPEPDAEPIRKDAMFYMASVTKPVIYSCGMLLVERGLLNLSDPVSRYLDRKSTRLNSSHVSESRMPSSA